jgi:hypothetical protein
MAHKLAIYLVACIFLFVVSTALPRPDLSDSLTHAFHQEQASDQCIFTYIIAPRPSERIMETVLESVQSSVQQYYWAWWRTRITLSEVSLTLPLSFSMGGATRASSA